MKRPRIYISGPITGTTDYLERFGMAEYIVSNDRHFDILKSIDFPLVSVRSIQEFSKELADEM